MKVSYNWLKELVDIHDIDPGDVAVRLTMSTAEIEGVEEVGEDLDRVVVGKIVDVKPHPDSDRLFLTKIDVGDEVLDIISGAPNTKEDTYVPIALIGAKLPDGTRVKKAKLRGKESYGIVCSEMELGVSDDHTGLWILNDEEISEKDLKPGTELTSLFPTKDFIIDIENKSITNRPDLWGHYGVAREVAAIFKRRLKPVYTEKEIDTVLKARGSMHLSVEIKDKLLCLRYTAIMLDGVEIKRSPYRLRRRLYTLDVRPINNIVDVTNYIMLEIGQPLHAFDESKVFQNRIIVRRAQEGELISTLDGVERILTEDTLLISDPEKAVAVAGVMGGLNSEIGDESNRIIIESANFNPVSIRRTAVRLGLRTEASNRFEKSIDPELTVLGIAGSVSMIRSIMPEVKIVSPLVDANYWKRKKIVIPLNIDWVSKLIGISIKKKRVVDILRSLQFDIEDVDSKNMMVTVPSFRSTKDVSLPQDLVEEVGRIFGYDNIEPILPQIESTPVYRDELLSFIRRLKSIFSEELGFTETYTYSFQEDSVLDIFYSRDIPFVKLRNPVSLSLSRMRRSLIPGLFSHLERNLTYRDEFSVFEIGSVYNPLKDEKKSVVLPDERNMASALLLYIIKGHPVFFMAKGRLEELFHRLNLDNVNFMPFHQGSEYKRCFNIESLGNLSVYHPGRRALLVYRDTCFGFLSELNPKQLKRVGVDFHKYRAAVFEIDVSLLNDLVMENIGQKEYKKLPRFPEVILALACVVDEDVSVSEVQDFISSYSSKLIEKVELFDIYRGKPLPSSKKNLAFNVYYRRKDRTLTEKEANEVHEDIARKIRKHGWELR